MVVDRKYISEHPQDGRGAYPFGWDRAALALAILIFGHLAVSFIYSLFLMSMNDGMSYMAALDQARTTRSIIFIGAALSQLMAVFYLFTLAAPRGGAGLLGIRLKLPDTALLLSIPLAIVPLLVLLPLTFIFSRQIESQPTIPILELLTGMSPMAIIFVFIMGTVLAPFCEEVLFRGFLYPVVNRRLPRLGAIAFITGLFTFMHVHQTGGSWVSIVGVGLVGLIITSQRAIYNSIIPSWITHTVYNSIILTLLVYNFILSTLGDPVKLVYYLNLFGPLLK
jgi:membrane protease YdiL (CAAX protease family)